MEPPEPPPPSHPAPPPRPLQLPPRPVAVSPLPQRSPRRWLRIAARAAELALVVAALGTLGLLWSVPDTARLAHDNPASTAFIDLRRSEAEAAGKPFTLRWQWRPLGAISRYLRAAVIYAEDYNFYRHDGVDWRAIEHAVSADWNKGAMSIGGSTITQQLAKNLYLSPRRSMIRKAREVLTAFALEDHLTKQRILELYLNVVEWGDGVFGAEAAARTWFHHSAQTLSPAEAVRLAIALPNPITRAPSVHDPELIRKAVRLLRLLRMQGLIDCGHLGLDRPQDDEPTGHRVCRGCQLVDFLLQVRAELAKTIAVAVLELVERNDVAGPRELADQASELTERRGTSKHRGVDLKNVEGIRHRREHTRWTGVRDLDVEHSPTHRRERLLDERGLPDATPPGQLDEEPSPTGQDVLQLPQLRMSSVETPGHREIKTFISRWNPWQLFTILNIFWFQLRIDIY